KDSGGLQALGQTASHRKEAETQGEENVVREILRQGRVVNTEDGAPGGLGFFQMFFEGSLRLGNRILGGAGLVPAAGPKRIAESWICAEVIDLGQGDSQHDGDGGRSERHGDAPWKGSRFSVEFTVRTG